MLIDKPIVKTYSLFFEEEQPELISAKTLSEYLYYVCALNALLLQHSDDLSIEAFRDNSNDALKKVIEYANATTAEELYELEFEEFELQVEGATKNSPFEIIFTGAFLVLVAAAVISGGEIDAEIPGGKFRAKLPPIAYGLEKLKNLFKG